MKRLIPFLFLILPMGLFAQSTQSPPDQEKAMLKRFGLSDSQVAQVIDIQDKARTTMRQDVAQLRLLHAQMDKSLLPATPNMQDVNGDIAQIAQTQADLMKTFVGAKVQLRQIIGEENFHAYFKYVMHRYGFGGREGFSGRLGSGRMTGHAGQVFE